MVPDSHSTHDAKDDPRNDTLLIYVNGEIVPKAEAKVSVYDSGFMLGDGMWEGLRLYNGRWAFFDDHMDRLFNSLKSVSLDPGIGPEDIRDILDKTAQANNITTVWVSSRFLILLKYLRVCPVAL